MPVTPFHFGPHWLLRSRPRKYFSIVFFASTRLVIDTEPLVYMALGQWPVHRFFHTYRGALLVVLVVIVAGKPAGEVLLLRVMVSGRGQEAE